MPHNDIHKATNQGNCQCMDNLGSPMTTTRGEFYELQQGYYNILHLMGQFYNEFGNRNQLNQPN